METFMKQESDINPALARRTVLKAGAAAISALGAPGLLRAQTQAVKELTMYYPVAVGGPITKLIDGYCADYEKETGVKVNAVYAGNYTETFAKAQTAIKGGRGPHMAVLQASDVHSLRSQDMIAPVDEMLGKDGVDWLNGFFPGFMTNSRIGGKTWSIPFQRSTSVAYYNKTAFKEAGLDPEKPPRTWAELVAAGAKLTRREGGRTSRWGVKLASNTGSAQWTFGALCNQVDHRLMDAEGTHVFFDHPKAIEALKFWRAMAYDSEITPKGTTEWGTLIPDFLQGGSAITVSTTGNLATVRAQATFPFGVMQLPGKSEPRSVVGGGNLFVFSNASPAERAAAIRFIRWVTAAERSADWGIKTGYLAVRPDAWATKSMVEYVKEVPAALVAKDQLPHSTGELSTYESQRMYRSLANSIQACLGGDKSPEQAMKELQVEADRMLLPYRKA
jgi:sn-glycerol 3-phosphate transport system substrate-binding protein